MPPTLSGSLNCFYSMKLSVDIQQDDQSTMSCDSGKRSYSANNSGDDDSPDAVQLRLKRQQRDAERHRAYYKNETEEQRKRRRERDALRHKAVYQEKVKQKKLERGSFSNPPSTDDMVSGSSSPAEMLPFSAGAVATGAEPKSRRGSRTSVRTPKAKAGSKLSPADHGDSGKYPGDDFYSNRSSISQSTDNLSLSNSANSSYNMYEAFQAMNTHYSADASSLDHTELPFDADCAFPLDGEGSYIDALFENFDFHASTEGELSDPFALELLSAPSQARAQPQMQPQMQPSNFHAQRSSIYNFAPLAVPAVGNAAPSSFVPSFAVPHLTFAGNLVGVPFPHLASVVPVTVSAPSFTASVPVLDSAILSDQAAVASTDASEATAPVPAATCGVSPCSAAVESSAGAETSIPESL